MMDAGIIRPEQLADAPAIRALTDAAFGTIEDESAIIDRLRQGDRWRPELAFVALDDTGAIVGHCVTSVADLVGEGGTITPILALGPISVARDRQRQGIGAALMNVTIDTAEADGWPLIVLLGHPTYYPRFGFEPARALGITPPHDWSDEAWLARRLIAWWPDLRGTVRFPAAFGLG